MKEERFMKHVCKGRRSFSLALLVSFLMNGGLSYAVDNTPGVGNGVAIGTGSSAPKAENVALGKNAKISYSNGASVATGDIAIGNDANVNNYASQGGSVAIGKNAKIENMAGGGEASFAFGQTTYSGGFFSSARIPADPTKAPASVAIGQNTFTRTGSTMIGVHNYKGQLGDNPDVDSASTRTTNLNVYSTTVGANSHNNGAFATVTGAYSIISSDYNGGRFSTPAKGFGATITGSLNSIETLDGGEHDGIANSIVGVANRTKNSNGALIFGAGNEITNSIQNLKAYPSNGGASAKEFSDKLRESIVKSDSAGSTMAFGGGNKADYTQASQLIGVNNSLQGTAAKLSTHTMLSGYKNTATETSHSSVMGSNNTLTNVTNTILLADNRSLNTVENSVVIGTSDNPLTSNKNNVVILGHNANVEVEGGVALGANSIASRDKGGVGYDPSTQAPSTKTDATWKATEAAVSIGDVAGTKTRQITGVAAGTEDTDAVNVAQLKAAITMNNNQAPGVAPAPNEVISYKDKTTGELLQKGQDGKYYSEKDLAGANYDATNNKYTKNGKDLTETNPSNIVTTLVNPNGTSDKPSSPLQNVGDGEVSKTSTEAINGKQLYETNEKIDDLTKDNEEMKKDIQNNHRDIVEAQSEIRHVGSLSAALAALHPMQYDPLQRNQVMAGVGIYRDKKAIAVGLAHYFNENLMMTAGVSVGEERRVKTMANLGITWKIGSDDDRKELPERYKEGPLGSIYKMQEEMEQVLQENKVLRSELNELKAQMKMLLEKK